MEVVRFSEIFKNILQDYMASQPTIHIFTPMKTLNLISIRTDNPRPEFNLCLTNGSQTCYRHNNLLSILFSSRQTMQKLLGQICILQLMKMNTISVIEACKLTKWQWGRFTSESLASHELTNQPLLQIRLSLPLRHMIDINIW
jgi:hypothetical protein